MDEKVETAVPINCTTDELDDWHSIDSKDSQDSKEGIKADPKKDTKWTEFRKKRTNKKAAEKSDQQDWERFSGDGVNFKAKLIGIKEVGQPRGDRLAQDALHELKASVKATNSHKKKITVNVSLEGIKIKDEKGVQVFHLHPVHKISFIAQDITDPRAFGYVFGSPSLGHKFFGIKTEKPAQQLVVAMRDLFHVVFELRRKELENRSSSSPNNTAAEKSGVHSSHNDLATNGNATINIESNDQCLDSMQTYTDTCDGENVKTLLDLDTDDQANAAHKIVAFEDDFFGDSATDKSNDLFFSDPLNFISNISPSLFANTNNSNLNRNKLSMANDAGNPFQNDIFGLNEEAVKRSADDDFNSSFLSSEDSKQEILDSRTDTSFTAMDRYAPLANLTLDKTVTVHLGSSLDSALGSHLESDGLSKSPEVCETSLTEIEPPPKPLRSSDLFSDLDPLGKDRPFVDKKDFFLQVKNPPKKVLKDLLEGSRSSSSSQSSSSSSSSDSGLSVGSFVEPLNSGLQLSSNSPSVSSLSPANQICKDSMPKSVDDGKMLESFPFVGSNSTNIPDAFDDPFFSRDFQSHSSTSLPLQQAFCSPDSAKDSQIAPHQIPPLLPPKHIQQVIAPLIKLDPPPLSECDKSDGKKNINYQELKHSGTLPIPIPLRKPCGSAIAFSPTANSPKSFGSISIPSVSPVSSLSMSSLNGTSCDSSNPSCPPSSLNILSPDSFSSVPSYAPDSYSSNSQLKSLSSNCGKSPSKNHRNTSVLSGYSGSSTSFSPFCHQALANKFNLQDSSVSVNYIDDNDKNNNSRSTDFFNGDNHFKQDVHRNSSSTKIIPKSIFHRDTDPFADDFFQSVTLTDSKNNGHDSVRVKNEQNHFSREGFCVPFGSLEDC